MGTNPPDIFGGVVVIIAPHMDDEVLACGGTIAMLPNKENIHVVYATDGSRSPVPMYSWMGKTPANLSAVRKAEARDATGTLGVPESNLRFLDLPDGRLNEHAAELTRMLEEVLRGLKPDVMFVPFRYDRHPDHVALHCSAAAAASRLAATPTWVEYFIYYRWRLLPGRDVRRLIRKDCILEVDTAGASEAKRRALDCYTSQTTLYAAWQDRPILPAERLETVSTSPEMFLINGRSFPGSKVLSKMRLWVPVAHRIEPTLKSVKEHVRSLVSHWARGHAN